MYSTMPKLLSNKRQYIVGINMSKVDGEILNVILKFKYKSLHLLCNYTKASKLHKILNFNNKLFNSIYSNIFFNNKPLSKHGERYA